MTKREILDNVKQLDRDQQIDLAMEIWELVEPTDEELPLTEQQKAELDRRIAEFERNPQDGKPWEDVRDQVLRQLHRKQ